MVKVLLRHGPDSTPRTGPDQVTRNIWIWECRRTRAFHTGGSLEPLKRSMSSHESIAGLHEPLAQRILLRSRQTIIGYTSHEPMLGLLHIYSNPSTPYKDDVEPFSQTLQISEAQNQNMSKQVAVERIYGRFSTYISPEIGQRRREFNKHNTVFA